MKNQVEIANLKDKSSLSKKEKDILVSDAMSRCAKILITTFTELGLKTHIQSIFESKETGNSFLLRIDKL